MIPGEEISPRNHNDYHNIENYDFYKSDAEKLANSKGDKQFTSFLVITLMIMLVVLIALLV